VVVERKAAPLSAPLGRCQSSRPQGFFSGAFYRFTVAADLPVKEWLEGWRDACGIGGVAWSERGSSSVALLCYSLEVVDN
jgi:hypothetical protein